jgi:hypothetical protein
MVAMRTSEDQGGLEPAKTGEQGLRPLVLTPVSLFGA